MSPPLFRSEFQRLRIVRADLMTLERHPEDDRRSD